MQEVRRVLHVVGAMNRAGTETMLMNIYRNIDREKIQFDFISYSQQDAHYDYEIKALGGRVIKLSKSQSIKQLVDAIKKYGPYDAIHSHTLFHCGIANLAGKIAGIKTRIAHAHTTLDRSDSLARKLYIKTMRTVITASSTHLLACSQQAGHYLYGNKSIDGGTYQYFPNLIDYKQFLKGNREKVIQFKAEQGLSESLVIGHIGRFMEAKNHHFLLEIMKEMLKKRLDIKLLLVGDGDLRKEIEEKARKEGLESYIRFVGIRSDIETMLHSMDVFVFPSIYEGLGLVLLEAQATGTPCIVSEAIQPEADLKLGLITRLSLSDGAKEWADRIIKIAGKKENNPNKIIVGFNENGYEIQRGITRLMDIYQI